MKIRDINRSILAAILAVFALTGCGPEEETEAGVCGDRGDEITVDSKAYCVYRQAVVVENGFDCPADRPHLTEQGGVGICSDRREIPDRDLEQIGERYRDENPGFEDCLFDRECDGADVCIAGDCRTPDNNGNNTNSNTNGGTNGGTNGATNGGTNGTECMSSSDCSANQTCEDGVCLDVCGGFAGFTCADDEWCDYPDGEPCGIADQLGTCRPKPQDCVTVVDPVCGCDNQDYNNECEAQRAGVDISGAGMCP